MIALHRLSQECSFRITPSFRAGSQDRRSAPVSDPDASIDPLPDDGRTGRVAA
ncbi:hypothetical protein [Rhizobium sp. 9140]|uniref:hypothetical protein n=1 Tax=Rhizobium sp. 9140 TaxID=1761900 RepID=UPI0007961EE0|nr:hypothetical protein [Rhizobium sp. 9140]CZT37131.1 hypothetical protein GA0004734_00041010 [Rhizobium sp. 9140]